MSFVTHHEKVYRKMAKMYSVASVNLGKIVELIDDDLFFCDLIWEDWDPRDIGETPMQIMDRVSVLIEKGQCSEFTSLVSTFAHETREIAHETSFLRLLTKRVSRNEFFAFPHETSGNETSF